MPAPFEQERLDLLISLGEIDISSDFIQIHNYPFVPSLAFSQSRFRASDISDIDLDVSPPTIRVGSELVFLTAEKRDELESFAVRNKIQIISRADIWGGILEPFLDTKITAERDQILIAWLGGFGLTTESVSLLRNEVKSQMLKYNFDTMLWEWAGLGIADALRAMRAKYNDHEFKDFYDRAMNVALMTEELHGTGEKSKYHLRIYENSHYMDEDEAYNLGTFDTYDTALAAAQGIVQQFFDNNLKNGVKIEDLLTQYSLFGEDPIIVPADKDRSSFSAHTYAGELYKAICSRLKEET